MFDFNKPKIEIAEMSEDKKYGRFVVEPLEAGIWHDTGKFPEKNYAFFSAGSGCESGKD